MSLYSILKIQEQLYYISIVAEVANVIYYLSIILNIDLPLGFSFGMSLFNMIYGIYMILIMVLTRGRFKTCAFIILTMGFLKDFIWKDVSIICIIDSFICIGILVLYHQFLYALMKQIDDKKRSDLSE